MKLAVILPVILLLLVGCDDTTANPYKRIMNNGFVCEQTGPMRYSITGKNVGTSGASWTLPPCGHRKDLIGRIDLHSNQIRSVPHNVFSGLTHLTNLYLHSNYISSLPRNVFSGLLRLRVLDLHSNYISSLPRNVFSGLPRLGVLKLSGNPWRCQGMLCGLPPAKFTELHSTRSCDQEIPAGQYPCTSSKESLLTTTESKDKQFVQVASDRLEHELFGLARAVLSRVRRTEDHTPFTAPAISPVGSTSTSITVRIETLSAGRTDITYQLIYSRYTTIGYNNAISITDPRQSQRAASLSPGTIYKVFIKAVSGALQRDSNVLLIPTKSDRNASTTNAEGPPSTYCAGFEYKYINETFFFDRALVKCNDLGDGWSMAMPNSTDENECVYKAAGSPNRTHHYKIGMWLGFVRHFRGSYTRVYDGTMLNYENFARGHPFRETWRTCALMWFTSYHLGESSSVWGDDLCTANGSSFLVTCQKDINECASNPCANDGTCKDGVNSFSCSCVQWYTGADCSTDVDECSPSLRDDLCVPERNGGTCTNRVGNYACGCQAGWTGNGIPRPVGRGCRDINECASDPCKNGGTCEDEVNSFSCRCAPGYIGDDCSTDKNECASNPCKNGGTCEDEVNSFSCRCAPGYIGDDCSTDINECASNPCEHGGTCEDGVNLFSCSCAPGYIGDDCSTDKNECASNPCKNGGTCEDGVNSFSCSCVPGYSGDDCSTGKLCKNLYTPKNGRVTIVGGMMLFQCDNRYIRLGSDQRECQQDGNWTGNDPQCHGMRQTVCGAVNYFYGGTDVQWQDAGPLCHKSLNGSHLAKPKTPQQLGCIRNLHMENENPLWIASDIPMEEGKCPVLSFTAGRGKISTEDCTNSHWFVCELPGSADKR